MAHDIASAQDAPASELVRMARERIARELERLPPVGTPQLRARLHSSAPNEAVSFGALVHIIRHAKHGGDITTARDCFVLLLERTERINKRWAYEIVRRSSAPAGADMPHLREDLLQDLTLRLWEAVACTNGEAWELFFQRALAYAQQHTAISLMEQRGYWKRPRSRSSNSSGTTPTVSAPPEPAPTLDAHAGVESSLTIFPNRSRHRDLHMFATAAPSDDVPEFMAAELTDLRDLVAHLPPPQRIAVVLRHWQQASEPDIAAVLGVTTRSVRNYLRRAYDSLRMWYEGGEVPT